jgi:hypothetical protein
MSHHFVSMLENGYLKYGKDKQSMNLELKTESFVNSAR